ncbi:MAG: hypothetical protein IPK85_03045 [Gemmatimonadetes bacterium]|nr:hypothetical protein [Gemmatimonadota bacterium]
MFTDLFYVRLHLPVGLAPVRGRDLNDIRQRVLATLLISVRRGVNERAAASLVELRQPPPTSVARMTW